MLVADDDKVHCQAEILDTERSLKYTPPPQGLILVPNAAEGFSNTVTCVVSVLLHVYPWELLSIVTV